MLGGAEAWPFAARRSGPWLLPAGPRGPAQLGLLPALGQAGHPASNLQNPRHSEPLLDSDAGPVLSRRERAATKGQLFMGRLGVLPRPALSSASPEKWGEDGGKVPRAKLGTFLIFPSKY